MTSGKAGDIQAAVGAGHEGDQWRLLLHQVRRAAGQPQHQPEVTGQPQLSLSSQPPPSSPSIPRVSDTRLSASPAPGTAGASAEAGSDNKGENEKGKIVLILKKRLSGQIVKTLRWQKVNQMWLFLDLRSVVYMPHHMNIDCSFVKFLFNANSSICATRYLLFVNRD